MSWVCRFNCGQWLSRSEDDGSIERFLLAEKVPQTIKNSVNMAALGVDGVLPSPNSKRRASRREPENGEWCELVCVGGVDVTFLPSLSLPFPPSLSPLSVVGEASQLKTNLRLALEKIRMAVQSKTSQNTVG